MEPLVSIVTILVLAVSAQWLAWRLRVPSILVLLLSGFLVGPVLGLLEPDRALGSLLFPMVSISVGLILFEGGLSLSYKEIKPVARVVTNLVSAGSLVTWAVLGVGAYFAFRLSAEVSLLLGAVLIVTGPTVVLPLLRYIRPTGKVNIVLKWEGIVIDPIGAVLAVLVMEEIVLGGGESSAAALVALVRTVCIGIGFGIGGAFFLGYALRRYLVPDMLQNPFALMLVVALFAVSNLLQSESGLLTTTVMGIVLANQRDVNLRPIVEFKENLRVLLIGSLFIVLSARLRLESLLGLELGAWIFLALTILVARPLSVLFSTWGSGLNWRERLFIASVAPRGIVAASVASLFSLEMARRGVQGGETLVSATFLVIVGTVAFSSVTARPLARFLGLAPRRRPQGIMIVGANRFARELGLVLQHLGVKILLVDVNPQSVKKAQSEGLRATEGDVLAESVIDELNLDGIGRLFAVTTNDEANLLASLHFTEVFGRAEVYHFCPRQDGEGASRRTSLRFKGRELFGFDVSAAQVLERLDNGASIGSFSFANANSWRELRARYRDRITPLLTVAKNGDVYVFATDSIPVPAPGTRLVALVDPDEV
ncbi:MAG: sodium:proton antiporter [Myxococcales bacterium]|nr:sodium:proton antiporter [Myxococcales bacterium]